MVQTYQLTREELSFLDALSGGRAIQRALTVHGLVSITDTGPKITEAGRILLEQARIDGALAGRY